MYTVYILIDDQGRIYKGMTIDIKRRIKEHNSGKTKTTSKMKNLKLAYSEKFITFDEARKRELYFKTAAGRRYIKTIIRDN